MLHISIKIQTIHKLKRGEEEEEEKKKKIRTEKSSIRNRERLTVPVQNQQTRELISSRKTLQGENNNSVLTLTARGGKTKKQKWRQWSHKLQQCQVTVSQKIHTRVECIQVTTHKNTPTLVSFSSHPFKGATGDLTKRKNLHVITAAALSGAPVTGNY